MDLDLDLVKVERKGEAGSRSTSRYASLRQAELQLNRVDTWYARRVYVAGPRIEVARKAKAHKAQTDQG